ncbi:MAG: hypothetical protein JNM66_06700 [Bryobacterales bacterium]|nr:hypothetical protein [Bryobacterales bacterium]
MLETVEGKKKRDAKSVARKSKRTSVDLNTTRLKKMIAKQMDNLENEENSSKTSVGELLKLLQVYKDLTAEQVKEVEVRWVDRLRADDESGT